MPTIDAHHHFYPSLRDNEGRTWSVQSSIGELDRNGVAAAIASLPPVRAAPEARAQNEWAAGLREQHPGRFGLFASLPLADIDAALAEIAHAADALQADGFGLPTSDGDVWLSDERFRPIFAALNQRRAVVFVHPYATSQCRAVGQAYGGTAISPPWLEFPTNTARLILGLLVRGVMTDFPAIRFIFCHGGGTMPLLLGRIAGFDGWDTVGPGTLGRLFPDGVHQAFGRLYFDCAQALAPASFALLQRVAPPSHLLFGSDYGYFPVAHSLRQLAALQLAPALHAAIAGRNAAALFPRFNQEA